jgi:hypothetical protein
VAQFFVLAKLPYASCLIFSAEANDVEAPPTASGFHIGKIEWPVASYAADPSLQSFRDEFRRHCSGQAGIPAALCVSRAMAAQFPFGQPNRDFLSTQFDPAAALAAHLRGEPGHCVSRSGILAAELLSVGIPARVVQLLSPDGAGHTIVAVWDARLGWQLADPSLSAMVGVNGRPISTSRAALASGTLDVIPPTLSPQGAGPFSYERFRLPGTDFLYPEPWLYVRTGPRSAPRPFHGRFAQFGANQWKTGKAQSVLRVGITACGLLGISCFAWGLLHRRRGAAVVSPLSLAHARASNGISSAPAPLDLSTADTRLDSQAP